MPRLSDGFGAIVGLHRVDNQRDQARDFVGAADAREERVGTRGGRRYRRRARCPTAAGAAAAAPRSPAARINSRFTFAGAPAMASPDRLIGIFAADAAEAGAGGGLFGGVVTRGDRGERRHGGCIADGADALQGGEADRLAGSFQRVVKAGSAETSPRSESNPRMRTWAASLSFGISAISCTGGVWQQRIDGDDLKPEIAAVERFHQHGRSRLRRARRLGRCPDRLRRKAFGRWAERRRHCRARQGGSAACRYASAAADGLGMRFREGPRLAAVSAILAKEIQGRAGLGWLRAQCKRAAAVATAPVSRRSPIVLMMPMRVLPVDLASASRSARSTAGPGIRSSA